MSVISVQLIPTALIIMNNKGMKICIVCFVVHELYLNVISIPDRAIKLGSWVRLFSLTVSLCTRKWKSQQLENLEQMLSSTKEGLVSGKLMV